jgi:cell pole-organizing protein PopZ
MAKAETKPVENEDQSMEEILQSIRRIIAEEGEEPQADASVAAEAPAVAAVKESDVLELTDIVTEEGSVVNVHSLEAENPAAEDPAPLMLEEEAPQEDCVLKNIDALLADVPAPAAVAEVSVDEPEDEMPQTADDSLLSSATAAATMEALSHLKRPQQSVLPAANTLSLRNGVTVEDLVVESLKPMLKEWLDSNLPAIVERIVEREIRKLT